ncbi:MAG: hypothetical protein F4138_04445 [Acidimicrobiia bacterium]|nr:hypothetical protein [Acidimicrobiia bacterium]
MSRRIEIELTSKRHDGSWTWRAAGARQPKGELAEDLIAFAVNVGDELTVEAEFYMDGIEIIEVFQQKPKNTPMPETLEILGSKRDQPLITTQFVSGSKRRKTDARQSDDQTSNFKDRPKRVRRRGQKQSGGSDDSRRQDKQPKFKRLRPGRSHREALIAALPEQEKPIAEKMVREGVNAVEQALSKQRKKDRQATQLEQVSEGVADPIFEVENNYLLVARKLLGDVRAAEWRDRVDAALDGFDELDLRDLRSVVVAAEAGAVDEDAKALAEELRNKLAQRVDKEHSEWLTEVAATLADGRMVRALRLSSRPPKAGVPLPQDIVTRLTESVNAALTSETPSKRWMMVLGAVAFSPVRRTVQPQGVPKNPDKELLDEVKKLSERVPQIAAMFELKSAAPPSKTDTSKSLQPISG